jgi:hypothetical protein
MLSYNQKQNEFILFSNDEDKAKEAGLTLSTRVRGPQGEKVWFTNEPYAAIPFYPLGDTAAKAKLAPLWSDYEASFGHG